MKQVRRHAVLLRTLRFGRWAAHRLARALRVSVRTIYRDIAALRAVGHVIRARCGPVGGFWREYDDQPAPVVLTGDQIRDLALAAGAAARAGHGPSEATPNAAIAALLEALPALREEGVRAMLAEVLPSGEPSRRWSPMERSEKIAALEAAVHAGRQIVLYDGQLRQLRAEALRFDGHGWTLVGTQGSAPWERPLDEVGWVRAGRVRVAMGLLGQIPSGAGPLLECALRIGGRRGVIGRSKPHHLVPVEPRWRADGTLAPSRPL